ncbi:Colicin V production protein [Rubripirellula tenax]|uniref:Colicin V production protein n=2 Tax=Rubripirellula tenax TaxID=2528015 RepID=A0A5C6F8Q9_9BACT|nr:Colicin V production protein [Rubripirellula tenax]
MQTVQYYEEPVVPNNSMSMKARLFWTLVFFGPATFFLVQRDFVAAAMLMVAGFAAFAGYRSGVFSIFASVVALAAAIAFAPKIGMENAYRFSEIFGTTGLANRFLSIGIVAAAIGMFVMLCLWFILGRMVRRRSSLDRWNRRLGFTFGMLQGVAGLVFFLGGMLVVEPMQKQRAAQGDAKEGKSQFASNVILKTAAATHSSVVGPYIVKYNPLEWVPELNKVEEFGRTAEVLRDPVKMQELLDAPEIKTLREQPSVQRLVNQLNTDPDVQEMLKSGNSLTPSMAMKLLSHPAVMELVDQPGFLTEAAKVIKNAAPTPGFAN